LAAWLQRLTCLTSARFRARAPGPVSGQLCRAPGGEPGITARVSCCLSAAGLRFLGILSRPGIPPLLRSAYRTASSGADPSGVSMFRTRETRLAQGALCTPGAAVSTGPVVLPAAACRISTASPCRPGLQPAPGRIIDEASARVHCHSPHTSLPLACDPGRNGVLGLFPELRTRPGRTRQRTSGRGQARTLPGLRPWHKPASFDVLTRNVRPHVARTG
jgi:hypothetical protein